MSHLKPEVAGYSPLVGEAGYVHLPCSAKVYSPAVHDRWHEQQAKQLTEQLREGASRKGC